MLDSVSVPPELMVRLLQLAVALPIVGLRVALAGTVTSVLEVGTEPPHQLPAVFQSVLEVPFHTPPLLVETPVATKA